MARTKAPSHRLMRAKALQAVGTKEAKDESLSPEKRQGGAKLAQAATNLLETVERLKAITAQRNKKSARTRLLAWSPKGLDPKLGAVTVIGPAPVELDHETWINRLEIRLQSLINQDDDARATILWKLDSEELPELREKQKAMWANLLFQTVGAIKITLAEVDEHWPVTITATEPDMEVLMSETTLEEWLGAVKT